jgi:hypothetical protein
VSRAGLAWAIAVTATACNAVLGMDPGELADPPPGTTASTTSSGGFGGQGGGTTGGSPSGGGGSGQGGGGGTAGAAGDAGSAGAGGDPCPGCGPGETCPAGLCACGDDIASAPGEEACPDSDEYRDCVTVDSKAQCGCSTAGGPSGSCNTGYVCNPTTFECDCTVSGCGNGAFCTAAGRYTGLCSCGESQCVVYGSTCDPMSGGCTCTLPGASCED